MRNLLLLSGGLDSSALAAHVRPDLCLTIDYGQKAAQAEIAAAAIISQNLELDHISLAVPLPELGMGDMADTPINSLSSYSEFWPFRNQFLITVASMYAARHGFEEVLLGSVSTDTRHKDGTAEFYQRIGATVAMQEGSISVTAPALTKTTYELILSSRIPLSTLAWAHSCHTSNVACGQCKGCCKHSQIMHQLGLER